MTNSLVTTMWVKREAERLIMQKFPLWERERQARMTCAQDLGIAPDDVHIEQLGNSQFYARAMTADEKRERDFQHDRWISENDQSPCCSCHCHEDDY